MSAREFTITELKRSGDGGYVDTPVKFTWTNDGRSAPRGSWRFGVQMRTVREDYPGVEEPVEQVLGPNFKEFQLQGCWDDRYNDPGFALDTWRKFEALTQRGSLCRFEFETVSIVGLLKDADFDYKRAAYIMYTFTVSPHYRVTGGVSQGTSVRRKTVDAFKPPHAWRDDTALIANAMVGSLALMPRTQINSDLAKTHKARLADLLNAVNTLTDTISQRIAPGIELFESAKRASNALAVIKGVAASVLTDLAALKSSTVLAWDSAKASMDFDTWRTSLTAYARKLALLSYTGEVELARRVEPKAIAIYKPHKGESLYTISQRFYGTPGQWQAIASRNGITTMTLQGTELLIIPERR